MKKKICAVIIIVILAFCLVVAASIVNFGSQGGMHGGGSFQVFNSESFPSATIISNGPVDISLGYTPFKDAIILYCTYTVTDSNHKTIDSALMFHVPFSTEYIISKTLTNLVNGNYTYTINAHLVNGTVLVPLNETFTVDSNFQEPKLTVISPQNQTYNTTDVDVTFNVNSDLVWAYYSLDGSGMDSWTRFYGNMTLHDLTEGTHRLTVSVKTEANQHSRTPISTQTIIFKIAKNDL